jgi:hypothetical protein
MTTTETAGMEKPPQRFKEGTFIRVEVGDTLEGILQSVEYRDEEKEEGKGKNKKIVVIKKPYYLFKLLKASKYNLRVDEPEDFAAGALVKFQGKGGFHADMKAYLAKDQGVDAKTFEIADEEGTLDFSPLCGFRFAVKRLPNEAGKGKWKGTDFTRFDLSKSIEKEG